MMKYIVKLKGEEVYYTFKQDETFINFKKENVKEDFKFGSIGSAQKFIDNCDDPKSFEIVD